jgi:serine/threonine-protein kinase HipA
MDAPHNQLFVHYQDHLVGTITLQTNGDLAFAYHRDWLTLPQAFPISLSLPLDGNFQTRAAHHFFVNLLPEENVRQRICTSLKISPGNDFALLKAIGGDCAGALAITASADSPPQSQIYEPITAEQLANWSTGTPDAFSAITGHNEVRLSLAGAQDKLPVHITGDVISVPLGNSPSTHLLKFPSPFYSHLPENETFVSLLARGIGLPVVDIDLLPTNRNRIAVVTRYDRLPSGSTYIRLHQEDFCQALGINPKNKYEKEGGPSLAACAQIIRDHCSMPVVELKKLLQWTLFNLFVGNSDAHGKNLSLLYGSDGRLTLAPFYDLVCTRNYDRIDRHLAMMIGHSSDPGIIKLKHIESLAQQLDIALNLVRSQAQQMGEQIMSALPQVIDSFRNKYDNSSVLERIATISRKQIKQSLREI